MGNGHFNSELEGWEKGKDEHLFSWMSKGKVYNVKFFKFARFWTYLILPNNLVSRFMLTLETWFLFSGVPTQRNTTLGS